MFFFWGGGVSFVSFGELGVSVKVHEGMFIGVWLLSSFLCLGQGM